MSNVNLAAEERVSKPRSRGNQPLHVLQLRDALLKLQTVEAATALSKSTIYAKMATGDFPQAIRLGARCTRWRAADITAWRFQT